MEKILSEAFIFGMYRPPSRLMKLKVFIKASLGKIKVASLKF